MSSRLRRARPRRCSRRGEARRPTSLPALPTGSAEISTVSHTRLPTAPFSAGSRPRSPERRHVPPGSGGVCEAIPADRARHPVCDRRFRRHRRSRLQHAGGRDLRVRVDVGRRDRCRRDHRLLGDVRTRRGDLRATRLRPGARAGRLQRRTRHVDRIRDREPLDLRSRGRRRRDRAATALRAAVPLLDPARPDRAARHLMVIAVRLARAPLRLRRLLPARARRRGDQDTPELGARRTRLRAEHAERQPPRLPLLRGRAARGGAHTLRGLLLLLRRGRGRVGREGSPHEQGHLDDRLRARRAVCRSP